MALGRQGERQVELIVGWTELPRSPGHAFYDRLQAVLVEAGFDGFAEGQCARHYAGKQGRPSLPPGRRARTGTPASAKSWDASSIVKRYLDTSRRVWSSGETWLV